MFYVLDGLLMSGYSEDDIRRAAEIREWLMKQISDKQEEVERLRSTLTIIDNLLKHGSFKVAANIGFTTGTITAQVQAALPAPLAARQQPTPTLRSSDGDVRPLKRAKDDFLLANAEVSPSGVVLVPAAGISLNSNTPPFRSFFLNRILDGMKSKDISQGLKETDALNYKIEEDNGMIKRVVINNYRDKDRLQEIFNTSAWVFTRMLEKSG